MMEKIIPIITTTLRILLIVMVLNFVFSTGFDNFNKAPFLTLLNNWFESIFTFNKIGIWVIASLAYAIFRTNFLKRR